MNPIKLRRKVIKSYLAEWRVINYDQQSKVASRIQIVELATGN